MEADKYLATVTRRIRLILGVWPVVRVIDVLRKVYARAYKRSDHPWTMIDDFDGNLRLRLDRRSYMGSRIYWHGYYSIDEIHLLNKLLKPSMVFVDIGANQGEFTTYAAKRLHDGKVLAFEPVESNYQHLLHNIRLNNFTNVEAHNIGLSDKRGSFELYTSNNRTLHPAFEGLTNEGLASMFQSNDRPNSLGTVEFEVFDDVFSESGICRLDVVKIDVEGAELRVLRGMSKMLQHYRPIIILEINGPAFKAAGYTTDDVVDFLNELDYDMSIIVHDRFLHTWRGGSVGRYGKTIRVTSGNLPMYANIMCQYRYAGSANAGA